MASSSSESFPMNSIMHMITNKLCSSNYLLWRNQILPVLTYQNLIGHVDGTSPQPDAEIIVSENKATNPAYSAWILADQHAIIILQASLTEEAAAEIVGLTTAREIWVALATVYSNSSPERIQNLRDQLRLLSKGSLTVAEFGRKFKVFCHQLAAIGHAVEDSDKLHWFLRGLGPTFESFSTAIRTTKPPPSFQELQAYAENHELFIQSLHGSSTPPVAFSAQADENRSRNTTRGRGGRFSRGGRGRGRRTPHCQLCRTDGHYANSCPNLASYASRVVPNDDNLAQAFLSQCHVNSGGPDWLWIRGPRTI